MGTDRLTPEHEAALLADLDRVRAERDKWAGHLDSTARLAGRLQNRITRLSADLDRVRAERNRHAEHAEQLTRQLRAVQADRRTAEDEIGRLRRQVAELIAERETAGQTVRAAIADDLHEAIKRSESEFPNEFGMRLVRDGLREARTIAAGGAA